MTQMIWTLRCSLPHQQAALLSSHPRGCASKGEATSTRFEDYHADGDPAISPVQSSASSARSRSSNSSKSKGSSRRSQKACRKDL